MQKTLITAIFLLLPLANANAFTLPPEKIAEDFIELFEENNPQVLHVLRESGYEFKKYDEGFNSDYTSKKKDRYHRMGTQAFHDNYTQASKINDLSKTFTGLRKWRDVIEALTANGLNIAPTNEHLVRNFSNNKCRDFHNKIRQRDSFMQCQFRVGATYVKMQEDKANCQRDSQTLYFSSSEEKQTKMQYLCMRKLGWKDPTNWKNNVDY